MIITIDGPTASGKSTLAWLLAQEKGFFYINSGLLFRALSYTALKKNIVDHLNTYTEHELVDLFTNCISYRSEESGPVILYGTTEITHLLKTASIDKVASQIATLPLVRQAILEYQRSLARDRDVVADGRDCGTVIFPDAEFKFFVTASLQVRAARWQHDQHIQGRVFTLEEAEKILHERDQRDTRRSIAPLKPADDGYILDTSNMTIQEALDALLDIVDKI